MIKKISPKKMLILDSIGALVSIFFLGFVLVKFQDLIGMPIQSLYILASIPFTFIFYDLYAINQDVHKQKSLLKGIAFLNFVYCLVSIVFLYFDYSQLTIFGWVYFIIEIVILLFVIYAELKLSKSAVA